MLSLVVMETPHSSRAVLHSTEHVVQGEVVSHGVLPAVRIIAVEGEGGGEPAVDLVQIHLLVW